MSGELREVVVAGLREHGWAVFDGMNDGERPAGERWDQCILDSFPDGWAKVNGSWVRLSDDDDDDDEGERYRRQVQFLEILADGGKITVNGVPWREMFARLNAIVTDPVALDENDG